MLARHALIESLGNFTYTLSRRPGLGTAGNNLHKLGWGTNKISSPSYPRKAHQIPKYSLSFFNYSTSLVYFGGDYWLVVCPFYPIEYIVGKCTVYCVLTIFILWAKCEEINNMTAMLVINLTAISPGIYLLRNCQLKVRLSFYLIFYVLTCRKQQQQPVHYTEQI